VEVSVETQLETQLTKQQRGGLSRSEAKAIAARNNGRLGGRPPKKLPISLKAGDIAKRINLLKFPPISFSHGWLYGVWYCGTSFQKSQYWGQFPLTFVKRITTMFPTKEYRFLHLCCGKCYIEGAVNVDLRDTANDQANISGESKLKVDVLANAESFAFDQPDVFPPNSFDVCLLDPPYSQEDSSRYGVARLVSPKKAFAQLAIVIKPEGWVIWLDEKFPNYPKEFFKLKGTISIVTGPNRRTRLMSMYQRNI
jgi:hypothetical protein